MASFSLSLDRHGLLAGISLGILLSACSGSDSSTAASGAGGSTSNSESTGGAPMSGSGGDLSAGGSTSTSHSGGAPVAGGAPGSGGTVVGTGGTPATGGSTGTTGLGAWTTGYVATMYGNDSSGDCSGYPNFSDTTNFDSQTCPNVTKTTYSAGVANNASYYGATGDLSSLWTINGNVPVCQCPGGGTGNCTQAPSCPGEAQSDGDCGICVAVKCDPSGTYTSGGSTHDADCSTTTYVVVQIIDACPHNHPANVASANGWCTSTQPQHIDLSCSGLGGISTLGTNIGRDGWLNVDVQQVACSIGLGTHSL